MHSTHPAFELAHLFAAITDINAAKKISSGLLLRQVVGRTISETAMQPRAVSRVVRRLAKSAGLGPNYSSHSLRAGLATSAFAQGVSEQEIQRNGRWKDRRSLDRYIRPIAFASRLNIVAAFG